MSSSKSPVSDKKLTTVRDLGIPVRIERSIPDSTTITGAVVAFGSKWVIVHKFDDADDGYGFDGYAAIPRDDLVKAKRRRDRELFLLEILDTNGWKPKAPAGIPTDDRWALFDWILETSHGLTTMRTEHHDPSEVSCGEVVDLGKKRVTFQPVSPDGQWLDAEQWQLKAITLVEFGGTHERALLDEALWAVR